MITKITLNGNLSDDQTAVLQALIEGFAHDNFLPPAVFEQTSELSLLASEELPSKVVDELKQYGILTVPHLLNTSVITLWRELGGIFRNGIAFLTICRWMVANGHRFLDCDPQEVLQHRDVDFLLERYKGLPTKTLNIIVRHDLTPTIVAGLTDRELRQIQGVGTTTLDELKRVFRQD